MLCLFPWWPQLIDVGSIATADVAENLLHDQGHV
jgi:hypothetical protein